MAVWLLLQSIVPLLFLIVAQEVWPQAIFPLEVYGSTQEGHADRSLVQPRYIRVGRVKSGRHAWYVLECIIFQPRHFDMERVKRYQHECHVHECKIVQSGALWSRLGQFNSDHEPHIRRLIRIDIINSACNN